MAIVTRKQYANNCNRSIGVINVNISRNLISVIPPDGKMIDTENPLNKIFEKNCARLDKEKLEKQRAEKREAKKNPTPEEIKETYQQVVEVYTKPETEEQKTKRENQNKEDEVVVSWDLRKKIADTLKAEKSAELESLKLQKMQGNLMPVDLVKSIVKLNVQHILKTFENDAVTMASIYCDVLAGGDRSKLSEITKKLRISITDTVRRTEATAAQEIENVIEDFAEARSRGERK